MSDAGMSEAMASSGSPSRGATSTMWMLSEIIRRSIEMYAFCASPGPAPATEAGACSSFLSAAGRLGRD